MSYTALALLKPDIDVSSEVLADELRRQFLDQDGAAVTYQDSVVTLRLGGWSLRLRLSNRPDDIAEAQDMASVFTQSEADEKTLDQCTQRVDISSDPDYEQTYFDSFIAVLDVLERMSTALLFDPSSGE